MDGRVERRRQKTEQVLDTATRVIADEGVEALTMHRLAADLEVAVGGLYRYFDSKETLVVALQRRAVEALAEAMADAVGRAPEDPLKRVVAVARVWRRQATEAPERHRLIDAYLSDPRQLLTDEQNREIEDSIAPVLALVTRVFDEARAAGKLSDGDAVVRTHVLWATLHGLDHFEKRDARVPKKLRTEALFQETVRTLLSGWGADADETTRALARK